MRTYYKSGGKIRKTAKGAALKRWFKEDWKINVVKQGMELNQMLIGKLLRSIKIRLLHLKS